jgi:hypothetical protein
MSPPMEISHILVVSYADNPNLELSKAKSVTVLCFYWLSVVSG